MKVNSFLAGIVAVVSVAAMAARAEAQCTPGWLPGEGLPGLNGTVYATTVWDDGSGPALYVAGTFTIAGNVLANNIAKWNGSAWSALGSGTNGQVCALVGFSGRLIAGGTFTTAGGASAGYIAAWNPTASGSWEPLSSGMNGYVRALVVQNDTLFAGGISRLRAVATPTASPPGTAAPGRPWAAE